MIKAAKSPLVSLPPWAPLAFPVTRAHPFVKTTLTNVTSLLSTSADLPCEVYFKNDYLQPSGSFKLRGIGNIISTAVREHRRENHFNSAKQIQVFALSGGNAGIAAAYSAKFYNLPCTVVIPRTSKQIFIDKLHALEARVIIQGDTIQEADSYLKTQILSKLSKDVEPVYCHPYNNPLIWQGHSSVIDEIVQDLTAAKKLKNLKGVVCSVGGAGLYSGIMQGLMRNNLSEQVSVLAVETAGAPTLTKTLENRNQQTHKYRRAVKTLAEPFMLESVTTIATSLACSFVASDTLKYYDAHKGKTTVSLIEDSDAVEGCVQMFDDLGVVVEPACGAAVDVCYGQMDLLTKAIPDLAKDDLVVVIACGGLGTTSSVINDEYRSMI
ncbi:hypothetical protein BABINDRAFT_179863 [Babjeviella inositovora NRRL Y-12698]|uniref:L-serine ammonia-lyase n=1 Tax=Babjeviella inositovora NRRL Y-12698 TaxID=984486 RepID=A0A1E3QS13_9ASCO|nr:uncharacterized protein BABINDRAFT_179863 [Babjeviella inositovora NRRL Y-12698]ODQ80493.1 hypothetical protein BABINDRAFT_179863 [Babjeviella inositovora NRRL Y-12698]